MTLQLSMAGLCWADDLLVMMQQQQQRRSPPKTSVRPSVRLPSHPLSPSSSSSLLFLSLLDLARPLPPPSSFLALSLALSGGDPEWVGGRSLNGRLEDVTPPPPPPPPCSLGRPLFGRPLCEGEGEDIVNERASARRRAGGRASKILGQIGNGILRNAMPPLPLPFETFGANILSMETI